MVRVSHRTPLAESQGRGQTLPGFIQLLFTEEHGKLVSQELPEKFVNKRVSELEEE